MPTTYLTTSFSDREKVKALGARWDAEKKKWYVPDGRDLAAFSTWLPAPAGSTSVAVSTGAAAAAAGTDLAATAKGMRLSQLLAGVAQAIASSYGSAVWTTVEVQKVDARSGHVYLEVAERDAQGNSIAQARAVIWAGTANQVVPQFERATGMVLGAGIKLLVRAKPTMHALYGLSLVIDGIDPQYSLGDLEARKREIRARLKREGRRRRRFDPKRGPDARDRGTRAAEVAGTRLRDRACCRRTHTDERLGHARGRSDRDSVQGRSRRRAHR